MVEAIYCYDTASVRFAVYDEGRRIVADIGEYALRDVFRAGSTDRHGAFAGKGCSGGRDCSLLPVYR